MRKHYFTISVLCLALASLIFIGSSTPTGAATAPPPNTGRVLVYRIANFGSNLGLVVSIDGKVVGTFIKGHNYSGDLPAGQHLIGVRANRPGSSSAEQALIVHAGQTYSFTARYSSGKMTLIRNR